MTEEADALETVQQDPIVDDQADDGQEQETAEDSGEDTAESGQEESPKGDLPKGAQKRIDRLTRQKYEARARAEEERKARLEAEKRLREIDERLKRIENPPKPRPRLDEFDSREEYEDALFEWRDQRHADSAEPAEPIDNGDIVAPPATWADQVADAEDKYDDFQTVVGNPTLQITDNMAQTLFELDQGAEVAYHLGKNPDMAARIAALTPKQQERELVKIEALLQTTPAQAKQTTRQSSAPEPITPTGSTAKAEKEPHEMTAAEFAAWRKKFIAQRR